MSLLSASISISISRRLRFNGRDDLCDDDVRDDLDDVVNDDDLDDVYVDDDDVYVVYDESDESDE